MNISQASLSGGGAPVRVDEGGGLGDAQPLLPVAGFAAPAANGISAPKASAARDTPSASNVEKAVAQINGSFAQAGEDLYAAFEKDEISGVNIVKIVDKKTDETVIQLPPEEVVKFAQSIEIARERRGQLLHSMA